MESISSASTLQDQRLLTGSSVTFCHRHIHPVAPKGLLSNQHLEVPSPEQQLEEKAAICREATFISPAPAPAKQDLRHPRPEALTTGM